MLIQVYNTLIDSEHIIGVGPLTSTRDKTLFHMVRFEFLLHMKGYSISVATDELSFVGDKRKESEIHQGAISAAWSAVSDNLRNGALFTDMIASMSKKKK